MTLFEYGRNILIVDCGSMFPESEMWGVDLVIPDMTYLEDKKDLIRGVVLTHGHLDHTGGLPFLLEGLNEPIPIYCTQLTRGLVDVKLNRANVRDQAELNTIQPGDRMNIGPFEVEFFEVSHSIPDGVGLAIRSPLGLIVHSGDFKLDVGAASTPNLGKLARLGDEQVLLLLADSTGAEMPGFTPPERVVEEALDEIFAEAPGRVIVATFASLISRVQQVVDVAVRHDRKVLINGRSMEDNVAMAQEMGYLHIPAGARIDLNEMKSLAPSRVAIIATGSQGEPRATLARLASGNHYQLEIHPDDTVVFSSSMIPGNEEAIIRVINQLIEQGADVIYDAIAPVHVSGHGSQEDQKLLMNLCKPKFFLPVHGEARHQHLHAQLAQQMGIPKENILILKNGDVLEIDNRHARIVDHLEPDMVFVDGSMVGDVGPIVLRDREILARDGFVVAVLTRDPETNAVIDAQIASRGFIYLRESEDLLDRIREQALNVARNAPRGEIEDRVERSLDKFLRKQTGRRPIVLAVVSG
jgi:ribonuclease J